MSISKQTKWNDLWPIVNILNEICNGVQIKDLKKAIGFKYEEIMDLLRKISSYEVEEGNSENTQIIELSDNEIEIIKKCFDEILKYIEEWEFSTRIGVSIQEARDLKEKLVN